MKKKIRSNIWKLYLIKALGSFMLMMPVIVLFFRENGLTMTQVFLLQALFSVIVIAFEVPTGYFADIFGRKISIILGGTIATLGWIFYAVGNGFWSFLLAEVTLGLGMSFISGADTALLYDTLLELGYSSDYQKIEGKRLSWGMLSEGAASLVGGALALVSLRFPIYFDAGTAILTIPMAFTLIETQKTNPRSARTSLKHSENTIRMRPKINNLLEMWRLLKFSLIDHKEIKWLIVYSALAGASTLAMVWFIQVYLAATQVPFQLFGLIWASLLLVSAFFSWNAHKVETFIGRKWSLLLLILLPVAGYFLLSSIWFIWSGIVIVLFYVARGINNPVVSNYINGLVSSEVRATVLSVKNLVGRVIFSIIGPLAGWINDTWSLKVALVSCGLIFLVLGLVVLSFMRHHKVL